MKKIKLLLLALLTATTIFAQVQYGVTNDVSVTGNITTQNLVPGGTATAGSAVELSLLGTSAIGIQVNGTYTGALTLQTSNNGTNWATVSGIPLLNMNTGLSSNVIASATISNFQANVGGFRFARVTGLAAMTGTATVIITGVRGTNLIALNNALPAGANIIGSITGTVAHSAASSGNPQRIAGRVLPTTPDLTLVAGDASEAGITTGQQLLYKPFSPSELDFNFIGSITNSTTSVVFKNAAGASIRNYISGIVITDDALGAATEVVIKDGAITATSVTTNVITSALHDLKIGDQIIFSAIGSFTGIVAGTSYWVLTVPSTTTFSLSATPNGSTLTVGGTGSPVFSRILYRTKLQTAALAMPIVIQFNNPLRGAPNATMDIQTLTATTTGTVYYNLQGYLGF